MIILDPFLKFSVFILASNSVKKNCKFLIESLKKLAELFLALRFSPCFCGLCLFAKQSVSPVRGLIFWINIDMNFFFLVWF